MVALSGDGRVAVATGGRQGAGLAATFDSAGRQLRAYGEAVVAAPDVFNMTAVKAQIRDGKVAGVTIKSHRVLMSQLLHLVTNGQP